MKTVRLRLEGLEDRLALAVWGNPWAAPEKLMLSFAPDGTQVSGHTSSLFQEMDAQLPRATWQREILRAFQTWAQHASINLSVVNDNGLAFGQLGPLQGGAGRGDLRVAAVPLSHGELAVATPFDLLGDWSGDVLFNTAYDFNGGGGAGAYDLYTVALQEAGHALGLPNNPDPASAMYTQYLGPRTGPSAADVAQLQALYGARLADRFDAGQGNNETGTATPVRFIDDVNQFVGQDPAQATPPWVVHGDVTGAADVDYYRVQIPAGQNDFWVELRTAGVSLFKARVSVLNASHQVVQTAVAMDPQQGNLALFVSGATPGGTYYVKVEGAEANAFGGGAYHLAVGKEAHEALNPPTPSFLNDDRGDDDEGGDGPLIDLPARAGAVGPQWDYAYQASVSYQGDVDRYRVVAPAGTASTMVVTAWALENDKLDPKVTVYAAGAVQPLAAQVLRNDKGVATVQVTGVTPGAAYEIRVEAADPQSSYKEGNYFVGADFVAAPITLQNYGQGTLTQAALQKTQSLELTATRLFHFTMSADTGTSTVESAVRLTIYNPQQQVVLTLVARAGETTSADILLTPGTYTLRYAAKARNSSESLPALAYNLSGVSRSDPIGPQPVAPTENPPPEPYTWYDLLYIYSWIVLEDAYSDPWNGL